MIQVNEACSGKIRRLEPRKKKEKKRNHNKDKGGRKGKKC